MELSPQDYYQRDMDLCLDPQETLRNAVQKLQTSSVDPAVVERMNFLKTLTYEEFYWKLTEEEFACLGW